MTTELSTYHGRLQLTFYLMEDDEENSIEESEGVDTHRPTLPVTSLWEHRKGRLPFG